MPGISVARVRVVLVLTIGALLAGCGRPGGPAIHDAASTTTTTRPTRSGHVGRPPKDDPALDARTGQPTATTMGRGRAPECTEPGVDRYVEVPDPTAPHGQREIWVHRPPIPDRSDLPVLYLLHGSTTNDRTLHDQGIGSILDQVMCQTGLPFVVAAPDGQAADGSDTEWGDADDGRFRIETFVTTAAIEQVEGAHRRPASLRAIGGVSMGGFGAAAIGLRHPDLYQQIACFAGYFHTDDRSNVFTRNEAAHAPDMLVRDPADRSQAVFLVEGLDDHTALQRGSIHGEADRFAGILKRLHLTVEVHHPPGDHKFSTWLPEFPAMVTFLDAGWTGQR